MNLGSEFQRDLEQRLDWVKERALEYCAAGDVDNAFLSLMSDLRKDEELRSRLSSVRPPTFDDNDTLSEKVAGFKRWIEQLRVCPS